MGDGMKSTGEIIKRMKHLARSGWSKPVKEILDIAAENEEEASTIIKNTFLYLDMLYSDRDDYDGCFEDLDTTFENLVAVYYTVEQTEFLKAWTFALVTFNYVRAVEELRKRNTPYYIG